MNSGVQDRLRSPLRFPAWERAYAATLRATDTNALFKLVEIAETAIRVRRDRLTGSIAHQAEQRAIEEALRTLLLIKKERLKFLL
jgi:hypothetical protein